MFSKTEAVQEHCFAANAELALIPMLLRATIPIVVMIPIM